MHDGNKFFNDHSRINVHESCNANIYDWYKTESETELLTLGSGSEKILLHWLQAFY